MTITAIIIAALVYSCLTFLVLTGVYLISVILFSKSDLNTFYVALGVNRFAFVVKGGEVIRIIYNSDDMKLIEDKAYPYGKFVPKSDPGIELQKLGVIEETLGVRFVGIPFIHTLLEKKMSWISVEGSNFIDRKDLPVSTFAITKTFGFKLEELVLGGDSHISESDGKPTNEQDKMERIQVNIKMLLQGTIEDPHLAIIATNWMAGVESKLMRFVQSFLGHTSQDGLIAQKAKKRGPDGKPTYCELVQEIIDNIDELQAYGVTFEPKKITYVDYELAGGAENIAAIQKANTEKYVGEQEAKKIKSRKRAEQEDMVAQQEILIDTITKLQTSGVGMSSEQAERIARDMLRTKGLAETGLGVLVEGGANTGVNISTDTKGSRKKGAK